MRAGLLSLGLPLIVLAGFATVAHASAKSEITGHYAMYTKYAMSKNFAGLQKFLDTKAAPDFNYTFMSGRKAGRAQMSAMLKQQLSIVSGFTKFAVKVTKFEEKGDTAIATVVTDSAFIMKDEAGKPHPFTSKSTTVDTWRKIKGKWMMAKIVTKSEKNTMDGKPVPAM
ncbi:MAG: nuclear transport factor 2 family protein [Fimbriimonadaceae bacterium]|nr:nuclear transport factor 2 family protein [Fimbriimonadaceae bacterium]